MTNSELYEELKFSGKDGRPESEEAIAESIRRIEESEATENDA